jgi:DNA-binding transcriptional LysR family regulator
VRFIVRDQETMHGLVAAGMGMAFLPESASTSRETGVTLRRLPWITLTRSLRAVTRAGNLSVVAAEFMRCLESVVAT